MADVFVSYKSEDRVLVETLARALEREGFSVWWDRKILAGKAWREAILRELRGAKVVIAAWSRRTEDISAASWMLNEVDEAARLGRTVIPVMMERCEAPFGYRHVQSANLSDWRGDARHPEWREVLAGVRAALGARRPARIAPVGAEKLHVRPRSHARLSPILLSVALLGAVFVGLRYVTSLPEPRPEAAAAASAPTLPETHGGAAAQASPRQVDRVEVVRFAGEAGVRGVFRRIRGDRWIERNSETGFAGLYHVNRENADIVVLHDSERDLRVRIDLGAGAIFIRNPGEDRYRERYRIVSVNEPLDSP